MSYPTMANECLFPRSCSRITLLGMAIRINHWKISSQSIDYTMIIKNPLLDRSKTDKKLISKINKTKAYHFEA